jgi:hypothetical protein
MIDSRARILAMPSREVCNGRALGLLADRTDDAMKRAMGLAQIAGFPADGLYHQTGCSRHPMEEAP